jgi:hypothetical protein
MSPHAAMHDLYCHQCSLPAYLSAVCLGMRHRTLCQLWASPGADRLPWTLAALLIICLHSLTHPPCSAHLPGPHHLHCRETSLRSRVQ